MARSDVCVDGMHRVLLVRDIIMHAWVLDVLLHASLALHSV